MKFTSPSYIKYLLLVPVLLGIALSFTFAFNYKEISVSENVDTLLMVFIVALILFFFAIPYYTFKYFKEIELKYGNWTITYPYLKRTIKLEKNKILRIEIIEKIRGPKIPTHDQINIRLNNGSSISISSMDIENFDIFRKMLTKDFKGLIQTSDFLDCKPRYS